jgi:hypothetical protein
MSGLKPRASFDRNGSGLRHIDNISVSGLRPPVGFSSKPGFDRAAFHERFDQEIVAFFQRTLQ